MTVVEAYVGQKKLDPADDGSQLPASVSSLVDEGLAQNTAGSVFISKVRASNAIDFTSTPKILETRESHYNHLQLHDLARTPSVLGTKL